MQRVFGRIGVVLVLTLGAVVAVPSASGATGGRPNLPASDLLNADARSHSQKMCTARAVAPAPAGWYRQETAAAIHELVASTPLDMSITNVAARDLVATNQIWARWQSDTELVDPKWTDMGAGAIPCADNKMYMTAVLRQAPQMPATGRYSSAQTTTAKVVSHLGIQYTAAVDYSGKTIPLLLDVYTPPVVAPRPRPTILLIHGGAFVGGSRTDMKGVALQWAVRGYDVVSIDYRLDQSLYQDSSPPKEVAAATNATIDAEQAVRWTKGHQANYGIDPLRIAAVGYSAGGAIALGLSAGPDIKKAGPFPALSSKIEAAVSTGAYLTPAIDLGALHLVPDLAPILMFHYQTDVASNTGTYAFRTCSAYRSAGSTCDYVSQAGEGHTTDLTPGSVWWFKVGPFIWQNLRIPT